MTDSLTCAQLRAAAESESASPTARIDAATQLFERFGGTARNLRVVRRVIRKFEKFICESARSQQLIRWRVEQIKAKLERFREAEAAGAGPSDDPIEEKLTAAAQLIGGTEFLPSDEPDDFWDAPIQGRSRRRLFCASWEFPVTHTRSEMVAELIADPSKISANVLRLKTSACSPERLDQQFEDDVALIRIELAARGIPDTPEGREQLAAQIEGLAIPLFEFRPREMDGLYAWGPELVRSAAGKLLDAIRFTNSWPHTRAKHTQL